MSSSCFAREMRTKSKIVLRRAGLLIVQTLAGDAGLCPYAGEQNLFKIPCVFEPLFHALPWLVLFVRLRGETVKMPLMTRADTLAYRMTGRCSRQRAAVAEPGSSSEAPR